LFQVELTLNLLCSSRVNPKLSAYAYLNGNFDFNKTPLAPPGTKLVIHSKPDQHASWAYHGEEGWYVGSSMEHDRCVQCYVTISGQTRNVDTLEFFPKAVPFTKISTNNYLKQAASDIITILRHPPTNKPFLEYGYNKKCTRTNFHPSGPSSRHTSPSDICFPKNQPSEGRLSSKSSKGARD
jgi:hypothetical protein